MCHTTLLDSKFVEFLVRTDEEMALEMRAGCCTQCGGALHRNSYPRKPRGMPPEWTAARLRALKRRFDANGVFASVIPVPER